MPDGYLSVTDSSKYLHVCPQTILTWHHEGKLKGNRYTNRRYCFAIEDLDRLKYRDSLSIHDAAKRLSVSAPTLRRLTDAGVVPCIIGSNGYRVYTAQALDRFLLSVSYSTYTQTRSITSAISAFKVNTKPLFKTVIEGGNTDVLPVPRQPVRADIFPNDDIFPVPLETGPPRNTVILVFISISLIISFFISTLILIHKYETNVLGTETKQGEDVW